MSHPIEVLREGAAVADLPRPADQTKADAPPTAPPPMSGGDEVARAGSVPAADWPATEPLIPARWIPWIFAAKTTLSALLALFVAFALNLDQPKWSLLTVFIVAQPASGLVLAKSFHRIIGSLVGAAAALFLVALFAQERVLFIGSLALWIGFCTFAAKYARNFNAYGFVLSGYTAAVVGIPGALDPGSAFYIAVARLTEIGLGIIVTATVSHLVLPVSLAPRLRKAIPDLRAGLAEYGEALLGGRPAGELCVRLMGQVVAVENLRASAIFEDPELRARRAALERLDVAAVSILDVGRLLEPQLGGPGSTAARPVDRALAQAAGALGAWRNARIDAARLARRLLRAEALLPLGQSLARDPAAADRSVLRDIALIEGLREFFSCLAAYAAAYDAVLSGKSREGRSIRFATSNDTVDAFSAGLRAALAVALTSVFWIMADWPSGVTATILVAVATARLATMEHAGPAAIGGAFIVVLATIPAFLVIEVLLPAMEGFEMFALVVGPVLFFCAFLMAQEKSPLAMLAGFLSALYFASANPLQDQMTYDAVGFINTSIAVIAAIAVTAVLFAVVAPDTPAAARHRFARAARRALASIAARQPSLDLATFETAMTEAVVELRSHLRPGQADDIRTGEAALALLGAGRGLIELREEGEAPAGRDVDDAIAAFAGHPDRARLETARNAVQARALALLAELRGLPLDKLATRAMTRSLAALNAVDDELARGGAFLIEDTRRR
jgi:uncharacterized membrane protein YccC